MKIHNLKSKKNLWLSKPHPPPKKKHNHRHRYHLDRRASEILKPINVLVTLHKYLLRLGEPMPRLSGLQQVHRISVTHPPPSPLPLKIPLKTLWRRPDLVPKHCDWSAFKAVEKRSNHMHKKDRHFKKRENRDANGMACLSVSLSVSLPVYLLCSSLQGCIKSQDFICPTKSETKKIVSMYGVHVYVHAHKDM